MTFPVLTLQQLYLGALEAERRMNSGSKVAGHSSALGLLASVAIDSSAPLKSPIIALTSDSTMVTGKSLGKRTRSASDLSTATPPACSPSALKRRRLCASPPPSSAYLVRLRKLDMRTPIGKTIGIHVKTRAGLADSDDENYDSDEDLLKSKDSQMNRTRIQRIEELRSDSALFLFSRNNVWCNKGCGKIIALDSRRQYYLDAWKKHRKGCKGGIHPPIIVPKERKRSRNYIFDRWRKEWDEGHKGQRRTSKSGSCQSFSCIAL